MRKNNVVLYALTDHLARLYFTYQYIAMLPYLAKSPCYNAICKHLHIHATHRLHIFRQTLLYAFVSESEIKVMG